MKKRYLAIVALTLTGCTDRQLAQWVEWYEREPEAAVAFAQTPEIQAELAQREQRQTNLRNDHASEWERIAQCESGRNWSLRATNRTGTYGGGLMIRDNVWRAYGGQEFAQTADRASKEQQIEVAERILDDVGWQAWDCA